MARNLLFFISDISDHLANYPVWICFNLEQITRVDQRLQNVKLNVEKHARATTPRKMNELTLPCNILEAFPTH